MSLGWIIFALFVGGGLVDIAIGIAWIRSSVPPVGAPPPAPGQPDPAQKRFLGRMLLVTGVLLFGVAAAFAFGMFGADFALPPFAGRP